MAHLMDKPCYMRNWHTQKFDPRYIVQLTKNYRNHPEILQITNELFYEGVLEAKAPSSLFQVEILIKFKIYKTYFLDVTNLFDGTTMVGDDGFPVIFETVNGECEKIEGDESHSIEKKCRLSLNVSPIC